MKTPIQLKLIIKKKKKLFSEMSLVEKRVAIAKDVIARIKSQQFDARSGIFCTVGGNNIITEIDGNKEVCDVVNSKVKCSVRKEACLCPSLDMWITSRLVKCLTMLVNNRVCVTMK